MVQRFVEWLGDNGFPARRQQIISSHLSEGLPMEAHRVAQQLYRRFRYGGEIPEELRTKAMRLKHRRRNG